MTKKTLSRSRRAPKPSKPSSAPTKRKVVSAAHWRELREAARGKLAEALARPPLPQHGRPSDETVDAFLARHYLPLPEPAREPYAVHNANPRREDEPSTADLLAMAFRGNVAYAAAEPGDLVVAVLDSAKDELLVLADTLADSTEAAVVHRAAQRIDVGLSLFMRERQAAAEALRRSDAIIAEHVEVSDGSA